MNILPAALAALTLGDAAPEPAPAGPWRVERIDSRCTLIREEAGARPRFLALETTPGSGVIRLIAADPGWSGFSPAEAAAMRFILEPGDPVAGERVGPIRKPAGAGVELNSVDWSFLGAFASAGAIRMEGKGRSPVRLELAGASSAVRALRHCEEDSLRQWGIDTGARAGLRRLPKPAGAGAISWFRWEEYPEEAVRARASGTAVARVAVDAAGRPANCSVVVSAGHPSLDSLTCKSILKRARFEPALDAAGKAVRSDYFARTVWRTQ
jgi:TonB family protein